jgi:hypothetical protein
MGDDRWPHGAEPSQRRQETFPRCSFEPGLAERFAQAGLPFCPETREEFVI